MEPIKVQLDDPIKTEAGMLESLSFDEPKAKHFRELPLDPKMGDFLNLAARLSKQLPSLLDQLSVRDMGKVMDAMGKLFGAGLGTGPSS
jgi:hypothetical protein